MEDLDTQFEELYSKHNDPWRYQEESRHWLTTAIAHRYWSWHGKGTLVEAGCAEGRLTAHLVAKLEPKLTVAFDMNDRAVNRSRLRTQNMGSEVEVEIRDVRKGLPDVQAEMYLISDILCYLGEEGAQKVVDEAWSKVKPGGFLVLTNWIVKGVPECHSHFGSIPEGAELEMESEWTGHARNLEGERYMTWADYRVLHKPEIQHEDTATGTSGVRR